MKAVVVRAPGGFDRLGMIDAPDPGEPKEAEGKHFGKIASAIVSHTPGEVRIDCR